MKKGQTLSPEAAHMTHELLAREDTPFARACLEMMDEGADINDAAASAGTDMFQLMRQWHDFADAHGITATDGERACIHVLTKAYEEGSSK